MQVHEFSVIIPEIGEETIEAVAAKRPDAGVGTSDGTTFVDFDREATSLGEAIDTAVSDLQAIGIQPVRVLVDMPERVTN